MPRQIKQTLPTPPPVYDQEYIARLADAVNRYMFQAQAPAEVTAARFVCTDVPVLPELSTGGPDTRGLPTGAIYLAQVPGAPAGALFLTLVTESDPI
jgi:hypothetical protein